MTYVRNKQNNCAKVGIKSEAHRYAEDVTQEELIELVERLNEDTSVSGFSIQLPLPDHLNSQALLSRIDPDKDVDGLSPMSAGKPAVGLPALLSCIPHGIIQLLERNGIELEGREAVVLRRSNLVGKPVAQLLLRENVTVTVCHSRTPNLAEVAGRADILIAALGRQERVGAGHVKEGAVVMDVGIHKTVDGGLVGDVRFEDVEPKALAITPVPGRIGPMIWAMLLNNALQAARFRAKKEVWTG